MSICSVFMTLAVKCFTDMLLTISLEMWNSSAARNWGGGGRGGVVWVRSSRRSYNAIKTSKMSKFERGRRQEGDSQQMGAVHELLCYSVPTPMLSFPLPLQFSCSGSFEIPPLKITYIHVYVILYWRQPYWLYKLYRLWSYSTDYNFNIPSSNRMVSPIPWQLSTLFAKASKVF
jgi:hypothetical protein